MKSLFKVSLAMISALFLVTSCSDDNDETQKEKAITQAEMQNSANPYDEQGVLYHGFLVHITAEDDWEAPRVIEDIGGWDVSKIAEFEKDIGGWDVGQISENNDIGGWDVGQIVSFAMGVNEDNGKDFSDRAKRILSAQLEAFSGLNTISPHTDCWIHPEWCKDFTNPVEILSSSNGGTAHDRTIKYINAVREQEAKIQGNDKMNEAEKDGLLVSYSIARHAAGYWYNESRDSDEPVGKITTNMIHLSTLGASTAFIATDTEEVGVGTAILSTYIATGRAN